VTGIAIAPTDPGALVPALQKAIDQGVQIVFIDKSADIDGITYIGTNNVPAATMAAEYICANVASGSDVAILQGMVNNTTGQARAKGSREGLEACGMNIVAEQPADWDTIKAQAVTENILTGNPSIKAIFASNDNMGLGAIEALRMAKMLDEVVVVGFDAISGAAESILKGEMAATIAQRPTMMGALGVESLLTLSGGGSLEAHVDTGAALVTADNAAEYK
jgi:ribose transport system substrate-binding protein